MTERGRANLRRDRDDLVIGPSRASWRNGALEIDVNEWTSPVPQPVRGRIILRSTYALEGMYPLDSAGRHLWRPIAPDAAIEVSFSEPRLQWRGRAYLDANWGEEPLERAFTSWNWSRAHCRTGAIVHYDVKARSGEATSLSLRFGSGEAERLAIAPPALPQAPTLWRLPRLVRGGDAPAELIATLEDAPFYARSRLRAPIEGAAADIFHESLSLDRLRSPLVRAMLPFRMPRFAR